MCPKMDFLGDKSRTRNVRIVVVSLPLTSLLLHRDALDDVGAPRAAARWADRR